MSTEQRESARAWIAKKRKIAVYCPTGVVITDSHQAFAERIESFDRKKVGLLWNGKPNGDFFLHRVAELLTRSYQDIEVIKFWEVDPVGTAHPDRKSDAVLDFIAERSDIVISAQGD